MESSAGSREVVHRRGKHRTKDVDDLGSLRLRLGDVSEGERSTSVLSLSLESCGATDPDDVSLQSIKVSLASVVHSRSSSLSQGKLLCASRNLDRMVADVNNSALSRLFEVRFV